MTDDDLIEDHNDFDADDAEEPISAPVSLPPREAAKAILETIIKAKGGTRREGQERMSEFVAMSVSSGRPLLLEGGTGTGKSIGYLAGILASGKKVAVAPHTKALQDQLGDDLELMKDALKDGGGVLTSTPKYAIIKGRGSYLCLAKTKGDPSKVEQEAPTLDGMDAEPAATVTETPQPTSELGQEFVALSKWADETETGDRSDVPFPVSAKAWNLVSVGSEDCTGKACPFYKDGSCFAEKARENAKSANVVVVNQSYLAMGMVLERLLPAGIDGIIVDEAHEFPSVVAETFGAELTADRVRNAVKKLQKPLTDRDEARAKKMFDRIEKDIITLEKVMEPPKSADRALISDPKVTKALAALNDSFAAVSHMVDTLPATDEQEKARVELLKRMVSNLCGDISLLLEGSTDTQVAWVEPRNGKAVARSAKFDSAETIHEKLVDKYRGVVFTSATLAVAGKFDQTARRFGMEFAQAAAEAEGRVKEGQPIWGKAQVGSPFDYDKQARLYLPSDIPLPKTGLGKGQEYYEAVARTAEKVIRAAGGRTLVLCTSRESVRAITEYLQNAVGSEFPVYSQEPGEPAKEVARKFAEDPRSVLVGTRTFWTGVSVEGDTCAAVVLDKVPFPSPGDPMVAARTEKADQRGRGLGFREVSLADALLTLVQGAGRLIRTVNDRGVVVLCDPRLNPKSEHKKGYARDAMASLPAFRITDSEDEVLEFLRHVNATANDSEPHAVEIEDAPTSEEA